jgi:hypothetical protein
MANLLVFPYWQPLDANGEPIPGGMIYTYVAGTTTPKATYTDSSGAVPLSNPVILDSAGRATLWGQGTYKFIVKDADGVQIGDAIDNVKVFNTTPDGNDGFFETFSGDGSQTVFTMPQDLGTDEKSILVFVDNGLNEYTTNGTFDTDSDWSKGTGWTIGSGVATATGAISTALEQDAAVTLIQGQSYNITFTATRSAGTVSASIGGTAGVARSASGTYTETIIAGSTQKISFVTSGFTGTIDAVSVKKVAPAGPDIVSPNGYTIDGTSLTFAVAPAAGTNNILVFAASLLVGAAAASAAEASDFADAAETAETGALAAQAAAETAQTNAETAETNAAASEAAAALSAASLTGTSTTSLLIEVASKVFTTQTGKYFEAGSFLLITSDADPTNYMFGQVTTYSGTSLTVNVTVVGGSGTFADWTIRVAGTRGAVGATGSPGGPLADADYGDITVSSSGTVWTIDNDAVTLAKMAAGTAGNLITYDASGNPAAVATGTSGQVLTSNGAGAAPTFQSGGGVFTESFSSTAQTVTAAGLLTLAHGMSSVPKVITGRIKFTTSQANWAIGDEVYVSPNNGMNGVAVNRGFQAYADATNVYIRYGAQSTTFNLLNKTTGVQTDITNTNITLIIDAYA